MEIWDGNKSPETTFNKEYAHSSKTEQASELTIILALYHRTTQTWQHVLSACGLNNYNIIKYVIVIIIYTCIILYSATIQGWCQC